MEFVKPGIVDVDMGKFYSEMFDARQEGDYKDFVKFDTIDIADWLNKADSFIKVMDELVRSRMEK